ncbi:putative crossover junction endonuclease EME2 isoform X2 [Saimiri boliviensis]|uniref:putative crossover junction endonuclease EME2 isoform X2 n=1 Tax=Saimiri boliviensis TaxID=27679 RepID=UPI000533D59B|nr:probable crossover junction endonuclease EME2 isoform X2 [Saimiri boliviensis boliviensis]
MARVGPGRARASRRGRSGQRRPATWDISDSDTEGPAHSEAAAKAGDPAGARRAAAEALRLMRPEQVLRRLAVRVDPGAAERAGDARAFLEDAGADVLMEALEALGCECLIEPQRPARSLQWTRASPDPCPGTVSGRGLPRASPDSAVFSPGAVPGRCGWVNLGWRMRSGAAQAVLLLPPEVWAAGEQELLLLLEPEEFLQGVATLTQLSGPTRWVPWITPEITARPHLAVIGLDAYLWSRQHVPRGTQPESPQVAGAKVAVDWPEVEEALVLLQLWANLDVLLVASWEELSQHVCAITKALAQCPLKQYRESQAFSFCTAGRWAAGEPVTRDGTGLRGAWWRQIRQFSRVSPAVADAVVTAFPSPRLLQQALVACSTERERLGLLADLPVTASEDGRPRRVGPDLSRRICLFLTTANPDLLLDLSS